MFSGLETVQSPQRKGLELFASTNTCSHLAAPLHTPDPTPLLAPRMSPNPAFQSSTILPSSTTPTSPTQHPIHPLHTPHSALCPPSPPPPILPRTSRRTFLTSLLSLPTIPLSTSTYDEYATRYDTLDGFTPLTNLLGLTALRRRLVSHARGHVLETGVGTGLNLALYDTSRVTSLTGLDVSEGMLTFARERSRRMAPPFDLQLLRASVDDTGLASACFDTIVDTFSLCVYPHPLQALKEMKRLIKHDGQVLLLEHTKSTNPVLAAYQDLTAEATATMSKGCFPNQNVVDMVRSLGFRVIRSELHLGATVIYLQLGL